MCSIETGLALTDGDSLFVLRCQGYGAMDPGVRPAWLLSWKDGADRKPGYQWHTPQSLASRKQPVWAYYPRFACLPVSHRRITTR